jgi:hypothetical protein
MNSASDRDLIDTLSLYIYGTVDCRIIHRLKDLKGPFHKPKWSLCMLLCVYTVMCNAALFGYGSTVEGTYKVLYI